MKKAWKILLILLVIAVYFNIGYWGGESWLDACAKFDQGEPINGFQKFQLGARKCWSADDYEKNQTMWMISSSVLWPFFGLGASIGIWIVYGTAQAAVWTWHAIVFGAVFLWNFFFCGGFFRLLGITSYHWILVGVNLIIGMILIFWGKKVKADTDEMLAKMMTIICGFFCILFLASGLIFSWWIFYIAWNFFLVISLILNILKI